MNKKIVPIVIVTVIVVLLSFSLLFLRNSPSQTPSNQTPSTGGATFTISTPRGDVPVSDFRQHLVRQTASTQTIAETAQYSIAYFPADKAFSITLLSEPVQQARDAAEAKFLSVLGINKGLACKLTVSLTVPYEVSADLSGKDYGLSFCLNGVQF